jgi:L-seryl-tRNA(Ser) seleniumtransferase
LRVRAEAIAAIVPDAKIIDTEGAAGGGSLPGVTIPSVGIALEGDASARLDALRAAGVVARIDDDRVVCDLRTVDPDDDPRLAAALRDVIATTR